MRRGQRVRLVSVGAIVGILAGWLPLLPAQADAVMCGMTVTASIRFDADLTCPGDGLILAANGIVIDLDGHHLSGSGTGFGIYMGADNRRGGPQFVTVRNGTIEDFGLGILGFGHGRLEGSIVSHNQTAISLDKDAGGEIVDNLIADNASGVIGGEVTGVLYERNVIVRNGGIGIGTSQASGQTIRNNYFADQDIGVHITSTGSDGNIITGNRFVRNRVGLQMGSWQDVPPCCQGIAQVQNTVVSKNMFLKNGAAGLLVGVQFGSVAGSVVSNNRFVRNGFSPGGVTDFTGAPADDGANIFVAPGLGSIALSNNQAVANADLGIEAVGVVDGGGNSAHGNGNPVQCVGVTCDSLAEDEVDGSGDGETPL